MSLLASMLESASAAKPWEETTGAIKRKKAVSMLELKALILPKLSETSCVSSSELGDACDMTRAGVYHVLHELELEGITRRTGAGRTTKWFLAKKGE